MVAARTAFSITRDPGSPPPPRARIRAWVRRKAPLYSEGPAVREIPSTVRDEEELRGETLSRLWKLEEAFAFLHAPYPRPSRATNTHARPLGERYLAHLALSSILQRRLKLISAFCRVRICILILGPRRELLTRLFFFPTLSPLPFLLSFFLSRSCSLSPRSRRHTFLAANALRCELLRHSFDELYAERRSD